MEISPSPESLFASRNRFLKRSSSERGARQKTEAEIRANLRDLFQAEIGQPTPDGAIQIAGSLLAIRACTIWPASGKTHHLYQPPKAHLFGTALCPERFPCRGRENRNRTLPCRRGHRGCRTRDLTRVATENRCADREDHGTPITSLRFFRRGSSMNAGGHLGQATRCMSNAGFGTPNF